MDLLQKLGFPSRFRDWLMALLSSATSRILLNGVPGCPIKHGQGLRQGDPLSPLLFDIAIDPLQAILERATTSGVLHSLRGRITRMRTSLYADDAVIFLAPIKEDVEALSRILNGFGEVTGLITNVQKSSFVPIQCNGLDLDAILQDFPALRIPIVSITRNHETKALTEYDTLVFHSRCFVYEALTSNSLLTKWHASFPLGMGKWSQRREEWL